MVGHSHCFNHYHQNVQIKAASIVLGYSFRLPIWLGFVIRKMYKPELGIPNTPLYNAQVSNLTTQVI